MKQYISFDDNCSEYFTMELNTIYENKFHQEIHLRQTIAIIYK